jgi:rSAM/selenodomain-associated transferase 1
VTIAVGVMTRAPSSAGKTRMAPHLSPSRLVGLRRAMLADTLGVVSRLPNVTVFFTPDEAEAEVAAIGDAVARTDPAAPTEISACVPQGVGDLGGRMFRAIRHLLEGGRSDAALLVGSDIPTLTADHLLEAADTLRASGGVVIGPADDGGYYLIGMTRAHAGLFEDVEWGTESVLTDTLRAAARIGVEARLVRSAYDVDTIDDLRRVERDLAATPPERCPALRRWLSES